jgi:transcriptional regulator with XRE-family HTH domain
MNAILLQELPMTTVYQKLGHTIRALRKSRQLSQEDLAIKAHMDLTSISELESGLRNPSIKTLQKISHALGVPLADLFR